MSKEKLLSELSVRIMGGNVAVAVRVASGKRLSNVGMHRDRLDVLVVFVVASVVSTSKTMGTTPVLWRRDALWVVPFKRDGCTTVLVFLRVLQLTWCAAAAAAVEWYRLYWCG
jgi:hypothetical protein